MIDIRKRSTALAVLLLFATTFLLWTTSHRSPAVAPSKRDQHHAASDKHLVSAKQLLASGVMTDQRPSPVEAIAHDGKNRTWQELSASRPVVLLFIKKGCPCNIEFEPFVRQLHAAYRGSVSFVGVIDGDVESARHHVENNHAPYVVLADPDRSLISRFRVENGAYVALMTPAGALNTLWPGWSAEMMRDLSRQIAELAGVAEQPVETAGLPGVLTAGCPFAR